MKIFFKIGAFSGGAPRSLLQIIKSNSAILSDVVVSGISIPNASKELIHQYHSESVSIIIRGDFSSRRYFRNLYWYLRFYKDVKSVGTDLLIVMGEYHLSYLVARILDIPIVLIRAGGENNFLNKKNLRTFQSCDSIVFSDENRQYLVDNNVPKEKITLYRNRIQCEQDKFWETFYKEGVKKTINLLLISRLDSGKIDSVYKVITYFERINLIIPNTRLYIAGDGKFYNEVQEKANKLNRRSKQDVIFILGHIDDIQSEIRKSVIIFGKGRSVIEPVMMNRIGVVVSEDGDFFIVNTKSYRDLRTSNFTGRTMINLTGESDLIEAIKGLIDGSYPYDEINEVADMARQDYHSNYNKDLFESVVKRNSIRVTNPGKTKLEIINIIKLVSCYSIYYSNRILKYINRRFQILIRKNPVV